MIIIDYLIEIKIIHSENVQQTTHPTIVYRPVHWATASKIVYTQTASILKALTFYIRHS